MHLILLHGNALSAISQKISEIKKKFDPISIVEISGKEFSFDEAVVRSSTGDLFSESRLVILENFDPSASSGQLDLERLPQDESLTILIKFTKLLTQSSTVLKSATKLKAQVLTLNEADEMSVFPFLDALGEKNSPRAYSEFEKLYAEYGGQYLLTMMFYLLRRLATNPKKLPSFVLDKLNRQKRNFNLEKVKELYKTGLETDFKIKSGLLEEKLGLTLLVERILN
jgi:DNA polymerase III delta subunit